MTSTEQQRVEEIAKGLSAEEIGILRHALGVPESKRAPKTFYRDHFVTEEGSRYHPTCMSLVERGLMTRRANCKIFGGMDCFNVNGRGEAVIRTHLQEQAS